MARVRDACRILEHKIGNDDALRQMVAEERVNAAIARMIYDARIEASLTQRRLAELVGTKQSVIARLEDADYQGHSLSMLNRIASALNRQLIVQMAPARGRAKSAKKRRAS